MKLSQSAKDKLYHLQRKYGPGNTAPWDRVAKEELHLTESYIKRKDYRDRFSDLGLHQLVQSQKAPWFVLLDRLAMYVDQREKQYK